MSAPASQWYSVGEQPAPQAYLEYTDAAGTTYTISFDVVISEDWPDQGTTVTEQNVEQGANVADHVRVKLATCELKIFSSNEPIWKSSGVNPQAPGQDAVTLYVATTNVTAAPQTLNFQAWSNPSELRSLIANSFKGISGTTSGGAVSSAISAGGDYTQSQLAQAQAIPMAVTVDAGRTSSSVLTTVTASVDVWPNEVDFVRQMHDLLLQLKNAATQFTVVGTKQSMSPMVIESLSFHRDKDTGSGEEITIGLKQVRIVTTQTVPAPSPVPFLPAGGGKPAASHGARDPAPVTIQSVASRAYDTIKGWFVQ